MRVVLPTPPLPEQMTMVRAGADVVQIYTGLIYKGPALVGEVARALKDMRR